MLPHPRLAKMDSFLVFNGHDDAVRCLAVADNILYTGSNDEKILSWDVFTQQPLRAFCGHTAPVSCLHCTKLGGKAMLFSGSFDQSVRLWDAATGQQVRAFFGHAVSAARSNSCFRFHPLILGCHLVLGCMGRKAAIHRVRRPHRTRMGRRGWCSHQLF